jgi:hypothetical protein
MREMGRGLVLDLDYWRKLPTNKQLLLSDCAEQVPRRFSRFLSVMLVFHNTRENIFRPSFSTTS